MDDLIKKIEIFLAHSEDKLEELTKKNQTLKTEQSKSENIN
ncbi:SP_0009 family protein [Streptococcus caprae]|uniref:SP_0009 family protein n=1 Tax=Streptococcus caprae TaxID=1640501 RepID=A0ABV8CVI9_9STRE